MENTTGNIIVKYLSFKGSDEITLIGKSCCKCDSENIFWQKDKFNIPKYMVCKDCGFHHKIIGFEKF